MTTMLSFPKNKRILCDLHCHFEGILSFEDIKNAAMQIHHSIILSEETWLFMKNTISKEDISLTGFFNRLTGRWIRLIAVVGYIKHDIPIEKTYKIFAYQALKKMYDQGIGVLELMISVNTLSSDGDLTNIPLPNSISSEEKKYIEIWNKTNNKPIINAKNLIQIFLDVIESSDIFELKSENSDVRAINTQNKMVVGLKYMVRREKDFKFRNNALDLEKKIKEIRDLFSRNSIVGVDIAGNEYDSEGNVSNYFEFLNSLNNIKIPFTIHAGEISPKHEKVELAYFNLEKSVEIGAKRIGHAVRLFDNNSRMLKLLKEVIEKKIYIEVNITSNMWTSAVNSFDVSKHPTVLALNGKHELFINDKILLRKLRESVIICDDDPVLVSKQEPSLHHELRVVAENTDFLGKNNLENMLKTQYKNSLAAML